MRNILISLAFSAFLGACGYVDPYEKAVFDLEPTYCYKSIGGVSCFNEPYDRDARRLVNYFGPHPSRFDKPERPEPAEPVPPARINYWVKDAEPIPRPAPSASAAALPWLDPAAVAEEAKNRELARLKESPDGTRALLKRMGIGAGRPVAGTADGTKAVARAARAKPAQPAQPAPPAMPAPPVIEVEIN